jgi:hypothetical protein
MVPPFRTSITEETGQELVRQESVNHLSISLLMLCLSFKSLRIQANVSWIQTLIRLLTQKGPQDFYRTQLKYKSILYAPCQLRRRLLLLLAIAVPHSREFEQDRSNLQLMFWLQFIFKATHSCKVTELKFLSDATSSRQ